MLGPYAERFTFLLIASAVLSLVAVRLVRNPAKLPIAICCLTIAWHIAALDACFWIVDSFRVLGVPSASEIHHTLITSLLSLVVPLISFAASCLLSNLKGKSMGRGCRILLASCCCSLIDLFLLLLICSELALVTAAMGFR